MKRPRQRHAASQRWPPGRFDLGRLGSALPRTFTALISLGSLGIARAQVPAGKREVQ